MEPRMRKEKEGKGETFSKRKEETGREKTVREGKER